MLRIRISIRTRCTTLCDKVCQWLATRLWFSPGPLVSSTNKTDHQDIAEILLKVALNTIEETNCPLYICWPKDNILSTSLLIFKIRESSVVWNKLVCVIIFCSTCRYVDPMIVVPFYTPVSRRAVLCDWVWRAAGGRPHRFPHNNFSSVYQIFTNLGHMILLRKGKNPIYFGVIRS
jgi:hypothetical protein